MQSATRGFPEWRLVTEVCPGLAALALELHAPADDDGEGNGGDDERPHVIAEVGHVILQGGKTRGNGGVSGNARAQEEGGGERTEVQDVGEELIHGFCWLSELAT